MKEYRKSTCPHILQFKQNLSLVFFNHDCVSNELFLHTASSLFDSNLEAATVKFRGWRYGVKSSAPQWQVSNCYETRSSSLPSRGGLICAFRSYFLKQNDNKSSSYKVPWLETAIPSLAARDQGRKHLRQGWCNEPAGRKMQPVCWTQPLADWETAVVNAAVLMWCFNYFQSQVKIFLKFFFACYQHFSVPRSCSHLVTEQGKFFCLSLSTVSYIWINRRQSTVLCRQKEASQFAEFHNPPVRCYSVWKLIQTSSLQVAWQSWQKCICRTVGGHPGFPLTLSVLLSVGLRVVVELADRLLF